jgi:membrane protein DedA with SNARE-associated domain
VNVEQFLVDLMSGAGSGIFAYGLVFVILMACGVGLPMPEDVSLILGGFLVQQGKANLGLMILTGYIGIIAGDSLIFYMGRKFGSKLGKTPGGLLSRIISPEKRARVEALFRKHGEKIVLAARFMPGVRTPTYFTAGSVGMRYRRFALFDSIAALASAPVFVLLGWYFGAELESLISAVRKGQRTVLLVLLGVAVVLFLVSRFRSRREARLNAEALAAQSALLVKRTQEDDQLNHRSSLSRSQH